MDWVVCILQPLEVKHFFKKLKRLKFDQHCSVEKLNFLDTFKWLPFHKNWRFGHETKARRSSKHQIFKGRKKLVDLSNHFWDIQIWKVASSCAYENQDGFPCQSRFPWQSVMQKPIANLTVLYLITLPGLSQNFLCIISSQQPVCSYNKDSYQEMCMSISFRINK